MRTPATSSTNILFAVLATLAAVNLQAAPGDLDTSFNGTGKVITAIDEILDIATASIQQTDGKIVTTGYSNDPLYGYSRIVVLRYNPDGSADTDFSDDGQLITRVGDYSDSANDILQQVDGKLVVAGYSNLDAGRSIALIRYNTDGSLDNSFDGDGTVTTKIGATTYDSASSLVQQPDGKLVIAGTTANGCQADGCKDIALARYNTDGSLDSSFSGDGILTTAFPHGDYDPIDVATALVVQPDGKLVAAGYTNTSLTDTINTDIALVRYNADGSLDTTFDGDGMLTTAIGTSYDYGFSMVLQADNKLVVAGMRNESGRPVFALVRYNTDGSLDTTFDGDGKLVTAIGNYSDYGQSIIQQTDGKLVVGGRSNIGSNNFDFALARYNLDGSLDGNFGIAGTVTAAIDTTHDDIALSVLQQHDGKLLLTGASRNIGGGNYDFALMRFDSGQPDSDNDGFIDGLDAFPADATEWKDTDLDGTGDNTDIDDDNDGLPDSIDPAPLAPLSLNVNGVYKGKAIQESTFTIK